MKNKLKLLLSSLTLTLLMIIFTGCSSASLLNYVVDNTTPTNYKEILPENGKNGIDGKDGKDGDNIDLYEIYEKLVDLKEFDGSFSDFVKEYLNNQDGTLSTNKGLNSTVSIYSAFTSTVNYKVDQFNTSSFEQKYYGTGSGVIFRLDKTTGDAYIITNYHMVYDGSSATQISQEISLFLYGKETYDVETTSAVTDYYGNTYRFQNIVGENKIPATYLGGSMLYDIAVLKVTGSEILKNSDAKSANFADSNEISVGETAIAIGNPSNKGISATKGIVSVDSEYISMMGVDGVTPCSFRVIRTDAAVNNGNSGGGLFNADGELIGIINSKIISASIENIGYAIPSNVAQNIAENILRNCDGDENTTVKRCILGINITAKDSSAVFDGLKTKIIETVSIFNIENTSVLKDKIQIGDILESVTIQFANGEIITKKIERTFHLIDLSLTLSVGDTIILDVADANGVDKPNISVTFTQNEVQEFI